MQYISPFEYLPAIRNSHCIKDIELTLLNPNQLLLLAVL